MSFRRILLPEPPLAPSMAGVPEIFDRGVGTAVRRAVIIGTGVAGAEHQSLGLIKSLGLGRTFQLFVSYTKMLRRPIDKQRQ